MFSRFGTAIVACHSLPGKNYNRSFRDHIETHLEAALPEDLNLDELKKRLKEGDYLEISTGGGAYEVWAEPLANPPAVYFEGEQHPIAELDGIAQRIMDEMHRGEIRCRWVEDD